SAINFGGVVIGKRHAVTVPAGEVHGKPVRLRRVSIELRGIDLKGKFVVKIAQLDHLAVVRYRKRQSAVYGIEGRPWIFGIRGLSRCKGVTEHAKRRVESVSLERIVGHLADMPGENLFIVPAKADSDVFYRMGVIRPFR